MCYENSSTPRRLLSILLVLFGVWKKYSLFPRFPLSNSPVTRRLKLFVPLMSSEFEPPLFRKLLKDSNALPLKYTVFPFPQVISLGESCFLSSAFFFNSINAKISECRFVSQSPIIFLLPQPVQSRTGFLACAKPITFALSFSNFSHENLERPSLLPSGRFSLFSVDTSWVAGQLRFPPLAPLQKSSKATWEEISHSPQPHFFLFLKEE